MHTSRWVTAEVIVKVPMTGDTLDLLPTAQALGERMAHRFRQVGARVVSHAVEAQATRGRYLLTVQLRTDEPIQEKCPKCDGVGKRFELLGWLRCSACGGTGAKS